MQSVFETGSSGAFTFPSSASIFEVSSSSGTKFEEGQDDVQEDREDIYEEPLYEANKDEEGKDSAQSPPPPALPLTPPPQARCCSADTSTTTSATNANYLF